MCYNGSINRSYKDDVNGNVTYSRISVSGEITIQFNPNPTVSLWKEALGRTKAEYRLFQIESMRFSMDSSMDESIATSIDHFKEHPQDIEEFLTKTFRYTGRWALKTGGWSGKSENQTIKFSDLPQQTKLLIHSVVGKLFDTNLAEANRMYQSYSDLINLAQGNLETIGQ